MSKQDLQISMLSILVSLLCCSAAFAQTTAIAQTTSPTITVVAAAERVRITAPASIVQMRIEVYDGNGTKVWDSEIHGNVFDWHVQDGQAQRLPAADYACVVTVKNVTGRVSQKIGSIAVGDKDVRVGKVETSSLTSPQSQAIGPVEEDASWMMVTDDQTTTVIAHDGTDGQIVRGRGAFSFRLGDFFSGKDKEQMRLSEEGNLGIGTGKPEYKLDVEGAIRAREGFVFNDGSTLTVNEEGVLSRTAADGSITPNVAGTGTQGRLAKWTDNAGTLGDSVVVESSGNIGIGVASPADLLDIAGPPNIAGRSGIHVRTTTSTGNATLYFDNDRGNFSAYGGLLTGGSANAQSFFGVTRADKTFLIADGPNSLGLGVGTLVAQPLLFGTSNTERMRITPSGMVGIGTDPGFRLDVNGRIRLRQNLGNIGNAETAGMWLFQNTPNIERAFVGMHHDNEVGFFGNTGAGWGLVMDTQTGYVGVGTGTGAFAPEARFHIIGTSGVPSTPLAIIQSFGDHIPISFRDSFGAEKARIRADNLGNLLLATINGSSKDLHFRAGDDNNTDMIIRSSNGSVGIGTTSPNAKLQVVGGDAAITTQNSGLILRAIDGPLCFRLTVNSGGTLITIPVACP